MQRSEKKKKFFRGRDSEREGTGDVAQCKSFLGFNAQSFKKEKSHLNMCAYFSQNHCLLSVIYTIHVSNCIPL